MERLSFFQLHIPANLPETVPQNVALGKRSARLGLEKKSRGPAASRCFQQRSKRCGYIDLPNGVVCFGSLDGASPNALSDYDCGEVAGQVLTEFQPEGLTDAQPGSCQERKQDLIAALCPCENLFDFRDSQRRLALFLFVYDRKAYEVEVPVPRIKLLAFARHG